MSTISQHIIAISPIGESVGSAIQPVAAAIGRTFGCRTETLPLLPDVAFAYDVNRDQYHSTLILDKLAAVLPANYLKVIAVTEVDLFIPILTYVYGEAQLGGKTCIISSRRLREHLPAMDTEERFHNRLAKEAVHELGHTFQLRHCKDPSCIMHYCRSIQDVDRKIDSLCRYCKILLADDIKRIMIR